MIELFSDVPEIVENNFNISISCSYYPKEVLPKLPKFKNDLNLSEKELLVRLSNSGLDKRLKKKNIKENKKYQDR